MLFVTIVGFVLILSILVIIHELGHFITAKKLGIKVEEFGFGFPPRVFGIKRGETLYSINLLPVGGFVKLYGEDAAGGGSVKLKGQESLKDKKRAFFARPAWQRASVILAGVFMNFVLAIVIISYLFTTQGVAIPTDNIKIVDVARDAPAYSSGLKSGDEIISLNSKKITSVEEFISTTKEHLGQPVVLEVKRDGQVFDLTVAPRENYPKGEGPFGIAITNIEVKKYKWFEAPFFGTIEAGKFSFLIVQSLGSTLFNLVAHGTKPVGVAGPVGVAQVVGQAMSVSVNATLWVMALLSLNLAVLNILPIPALDGGRLFFIIIELVTRRKVNPKYENYAHAAGLFILLGLMVVITFFDIIRVIAGKSIIAP